MLEQLHAATFSAQIHTPFTIHLPPGQEVQTIEVSLVEVSEWESGSGRRARAAARQEQFSLLFRGPHDRMLRQGMYRTQHDQLGTFDLFIVPVSQDKDGVYYEAVFNRLRRQDG